MSEKVKKNRVHARRRHRLAWDVMLKVTWIAGESYAVICSIAYKTNKPGTEESEKGAQKPTVEDKMRSRVASKRDDLHEQFSNVLAKEVDVFSAQGVKTATFLVLKSQLICVHHSKKCLKWVKEST